MFVELIYQDTLGDRFTLHRATALHRWTSSLTLRLQTYSRSGAACIPFHLTRFGFLAPEFPFLLAHYWIENTAGMVSFQTQNYFN